MHERTRGMILTALFAALMAVCAWLSVPAPVPFTMQTFGVFAAVGLLGGRRGTEAVALYILLGAVGLPVFAGFVGGLGVIFSSVGGYILGFLLAALVMWGITHRWGFGLLPLTLSMVLGLLVCYAFGTAWFMIFYAAADKPMSLVTALGACVLPFILPDAAKIALAVVVTRRVRRLRDPAQPSA